MTTNMRNKFKKGMEIKSVRQQQKGKKGKEEIIKGRGKGNQ